MSNLIFIYKYKYRRYRRIRRKRNLLIKICLFFILKLQLAISARILYFIYLFKEYFAWKGLYNNSVSSTVCLDRYNVEIDATKTTTNASYIILVFFLFKLNPKIWNIYSIKELEKIESNKQINKQNYFRNWIYIYI